MDRERHRETWTERQRDRVRERAASNLQKPAALQHVLLAVSMKCTTARNTIESTKADSLLSTVFWSQKERPPSSPVQGYHQEKPEA